MPSLVVRNQNKIFADVLMHINQNMLDKQGSAMYYLFYDQH